MSERTAKICPIRTLLYINAPITEKSLCECIEEKCALWVELERPRDEHAHAFNYRWVYQGCGLIKSIPWVREKLEESQSPRGDQVAPVTAKKEE